MEKKTYNEVIMMVKLEESTPKIFGDKKRVNWPIPPGWGLNHAQINGPTIQVSEIL